MVERLETVVHENAQLREQVGQVKLKAQSEVHSVNTSARSSAEQYINLYRQQARACALRFRPRLCERLATKSPPRPHLTRIPPTRPI